MKPEIPGDHLDQCGSETRLWPKRSTLISAKEIELEYGAAGVDIIHVSQIKKIFFKTVHKCILRIYYLLFFT